MKTFKKIRITSRNRHNIAKFSHLREIYLEFKLTFAICNKQLHVHFSLQSYYCIECLRTSIVKICKFTIKKVCSAFSHYAPLCLLCIISTQKKIVVRFLIHLLCFKYKLNQQVKLGFRQEKKLKQQFLNIEESFCSHSTAITVQQS